MLRERASEVRITASREVGRLDTPFSAPILRQTPAPHRDAFVMDGHMHVMRRQLLERSGIGQRYPGGHFYLPRARAGGLAALFFPVYTPEPYYPGGHEVKNTFRALELP